MIGALTRLGVTIVSTVEVEGHPAGVGLMQQPVSDRLQCDRHPQLRRGFGGLLTILD